MSEQARPGLRLDGVAQGTSGDVELRFPRGEETRAEAAATLVGVLQPVVARYLGASWQGVVRLELLEQARAGGANPVTGTLRHALRSFDERSPRSAGALSYELGRILLYRATAEDAFPGAAPRHPDWLLEAALSPLRYVWLGAESWVEAVAEKVALFRWRKPFPGALLRDMGRLNPRQRVVASAQCLLRSQTLTRAHPDWVRQWCADLAGTPGVDGERALERVTGTALADWEVRFDEDLAQAAATVRSSPPADW
ncbi:MAG TPA: hypothetical protein VKA00_08995 [Trueperaceae bacterium]|nr:hypothetical protein [Trueperaceae bacterium]